MLSLSLVISMNAFIDRFFSRLNSKNISYCHFKSNNNLNYALDGEGDLDLLISRDCIAEFNRVLSEFKFRVTCAWGGLSNPYVFHYFSCDPENGKIIHLHVYFKLITGGSLVKNTWLPLEKMLLEESYLLSDKNIYVPRKEADIIVFVLRKMLEQLSITEHFLYFKDKQNILAELNWLLEGVDFNNLNNLLAKWMPFFTPTLFYKCIHSIKTDNAISRIALGFLTSIKCGFKLKSPPLVELHRVKIMLKIFICNKIGLRLKNKILCPSGAIIAFVGSEASGKSTLSREIYNWLARDFTVTHKHLGKPNHAYITKPIWWSIKCLYQVKNILLGFFKCKTRDKPTKNIESSNINNLNIPNPIVCVLDAIDRFYAVKKCVRKVLNGELVITDRYPSCVLNAPDSPKIPKNSRTPILLEKLEKYFYRKIIQPDIVFRVQAPLELTIARNAEREKSEPEEFVRTRYKQSKLLSFDQCQVVDIFTNEKLNESTLKVKMSLWDLL